MSDEETAKLQKFLESRIIKIGDREKFEINTGLEREQISFSISTKEYGVIGSIFADKLIVKGKNLFIIKDRECIATFFGCKYEAKAYTGKLGSIIIHREK